MPRGSTNSLRRVTTEWFVLAQCNITPNTAVGLLKETWLHPTALLGTPYSAQLANCTHRMEHWWQLRVYTTSASFTGARVAALALPDPTYIGGLTAQAVWGAVANGRGSMIDSTGNLSRDTRFHLRGSTTQLSNATPPGNGNMLGFAEAVMILYLLQPPIGLGENAAINVTVLARCCLTGCNPIPGYLAAQIPTGPPPHAPQPGLTPDWIMKFNTTSGTGGSEDFADNQSMGDWALNHVGDAWLAGGYYWLFKDYGKPAPKEITGIPRYGSVYTASRDFPEWTTNWGRRAVPKYFAAFRGAISGTVCLVGFTNLEWAVSQASGHTGMVPQNAELCITYSRMPKWGEFCPSEGNYREIGFYEVHRSEPPRGGTVYTTSNAMSTAAALTSGTATYATTFPQQALALASSSQYHQPVSSTGCWSAPYNASTEISQQLTRHSSLSSISSSHWSQCSEDWAPCAPSAPSADLLAQEAQHYQQLAVHYQQQLETTTAQLHSLALQAFERCLGDGEISDLQRRALDVLSPSGLGIPNPSLPQTLTQDSHEDAEDHSTPSVSQEENSWGELGPVEESIEVLGHGPDSLPQCSAGPQAGPASPPPTLPSGLPAWTTLLKQALKQAAAPLGAEATELD